MAIIYLEFGLFTRKQYWLDLNKMIKQKKINQNCDTRLFKDWQFTIE